MLPLLFEYHIKILTMYWKISCCDTNLHIFLLVIFAVKYIICKRKDGSLEGYHCISIICTKEKDLRYESITHCQKYRLRANDTLWKSSVNCTVNCSRCPHCCLLGDLQLGISKTNFRTFSCSTILKSKIFITESFRKLKN